MIMLLGIIPYRVRNIMKSTTKSLAMLDHDEQLAKKF
jgi:hypothetical protein